MALGNLTEVTSTVGIHDMSGEQVEEWTTGDLFKVSATGKELTVQRIAYDGEDPNNFVLFYGTEPWQYYHRIEVERP